MTTPAEAVTDPVGTVVSLVAAADPALGHDLVRRIVEQVGGGRSKRRRLAAELAGNPSVLITGRSPASKVAGDLMLALRAAGATGISPPWCADCGRRVTSMQRRGDQAPRLPALPARDHVEQATGRAEDLPQLLCPRSSRPLHEMRNKA